MCVGVGKRARERESNTGQSVAVTYVLRLPGVIASPACNDVDGRWEGCLTGRRAVVLKCDGGEIGIGIGRVELRLRLMVEIRKHLSLREREREMIYFTSIRILLFQGNISIWFYQKKFSYNVYGAFFLSQNFYCAYCIFSFQFPRD